VKKERIAPQKKNASLEREKKKLLYPEPEKRPLKRGKKETWWITQKWLQGKRKEGPLQETVPLRADHESTVEGKSRLTTNEEWKAQRGSAKSVFRYSGKRKKGLSLGDTRTATQTGKTRSLRGNAEPYFREEKILFTKKKRTAAARKRSIG